MRIFEVGTVLIHGIAFRSPSSKVRSFIPLFFIKYARAQCAGESPSATSTVLDASLVRCSGRSSTCGPVLTCLSIRNASLVSPLIFGVSQVLHFSGGSERRAWSVSGRLDTFVALAALVWEAVRDLGPLDLVGPSESESTPTVTTRDDRDAAATQRVQEGAVVRQLLSGLRAAQHAAARGALGPGDAAGFWRVS